MEKHKTIILFFLLMTFYNVVFAGDLSITATSSADGKKITIKSKVNLGGVTTVSYVVSVSGPLVVIIILAQL